MIVVDSNGYNGVVYPYTVSVGVRIAFSYSSIKSISTKKVRGRDRGDRIEIGAYPKRAVCYDLQIDLNNLLRENKLKTIGNFTTSKVTETQNVYEYNGKKYCRLKADFFARPTELSNGRVYGPYDYVWVEVSSITCLVDEEKDIAITENIVLGGVLFEDSPYYRGDFEITTMYWYLNNIFIKELLQFETTKKIQELNDDYLKLIKMTDLMMLPQYFTNEEFAILMLLKRNLDIDQVAKVMNIFQVFILETIKKMMTLYQNMLINSFENVEHKIKELKTP